LDNTANWTQAFANEISALANTFNGLPVTHGTAKFNVGVMFADEPQSQQQYQGGYVRAASVPDHEQGQYKP